MCACTRVQTIRSEQSMESLLSPCSPGWLWASFNDVEHPCQECGTAVEDGRAFCPQCRAPQIHVQVAVPETAVATGLNSAPDEYPTGALRSVEADRAAMVGGGMPARGTMDRGAIVRAAIKAGVLGVFIGMIPFVGTVLTGALAVYFYRRENGFLLPASLGGRLGAAAGVVAFAINSLLIAVRIFAFHARQEYIDSI